MTKEEVYARLVKRLSMAGYLVQQSGNEYRWNDGADIGPPEATPEAAWCGAMERWFNDKA